MLSDSGRGDAAAKVPKARSVEMAVNIYIIQSVYVTLWGIESDRFLRSDKDSGPVFCSDKGEGYGSALDTTELV